MSINTEKNSYTILFAVAMVVVVGSILAYVASSLSGRISENKKIEAQQNILYAMGVNNDDSPYSGTGSVEFISTQKAGGEFKNYIKNQYIIQGDEISEDPNAYMVDLSKEEQKAKKADYQKKLPLYIGEKDGEKYYIIPMRGKGLWDAIWGYMALNTDLSVKGVYFDHAGETPGLGANIKERYFMDDFHGEHIVDEKGNFKGIKVTKGNMDPLNGTKKDYEVDAISGATITGDGVTAMIKNSLKPYIPYLKKLTKEKK